MRLGKSEIRILSSCPEPKKRDDHCSGALLGDVVEIARVREGIHEIFGTMFNKIHLKDLFKPYQYERLRDVIISRIAHPDSKRQTAELLTRDYLKPLSPGQIYRLMDTLPPIEKEIKKRIFETSKCFMDDNHVDILFFDVTTLHFESQVADNLRDFGMSKAHKIGEVQVVLALATTSNGLPIGYNLFSGKTAEITTLLTSLAEWTQTLNIADVTVVADRAMMSRTNLSAMEQAKFKYTVAAKLRSLPKPLKDKILERSQESLVTVSRQPMNIQEHLHEGRRLIVSYSESRAKKDRKDREKLLARIQKKLGSKVDEKALITNKGYLKYFKEETKGKMVLNEAKVTEDALWDGLHGIITNDATATPIKLLERYRGLWVIEESFRINKHTLEMRPIYHSKTNRIESHILICYIAYAVARYTQMQISKYHKTMSIEKIRTELKRVESSLLEDDATGKMYKLPSAVSTEMKAIYKAVGMKRTRHPEMVVQSKKRSGKQKTYVANS
jgi:transposase